MASTLVLFCACKSPEARPEAAAPSQPPKPQRPTGVTSPATSAEACALPSSPVSSQASDKNIDDRPLEVCGTSPLTGFFRDGRCSTGADDTGVHVVCSEVTQAFLQFSKARGNDLLTPRGGFQGLKPGDRWCLCAARWREANEAGVGPPVVIEATHQAAVSVVPATELRAHRTSVR